MGDCIRTRSKNATQRPGVIDLPAPRRSSAEVAEENAANLKKLADALAAREDLNKMVLDLELATKQKEADSLKPSVPPSRRGQASTTTTKAPRARKGRASKENQVVAKTPTPTANANPDDDLRKSVSA